MQKIDTNSREFKSLSRLQQATLIWNGMKAIDPEGCAQVEASVQRNMQAARTAGAFSRGAARRRKG
jgi:hypothetical protein